MQLRPYRLLALLASCLLAAPAAGQDLTGTGSAQAAIVEPLRTVRLSDLSFGALTVGTQADGEVEVSAQGNLVRFSGSAAQMCGGSANCLAHPGRFAVNGEASRTYQVSLPDSIDAMGRETGQTLHVSGLNMRSRNLSGGLSCSWCGLLDSDGSDEFAIGGLLHVPAGTQADTFQADLPVSVAYD